MKFKKASVFYYNKSNFIVPINDLGIIFKPREVADLFVKNKKLFWSSYQNSLISGDLSGKLSKLIPVKDGTKYANQPNVSYQVPVEPTASRGSTAIDVGLEERDYIKHLEGEFGSSEPMSEAEAWNKELQAYLKKIDNSTTSDDGELLSDNFFDEI